jgi:hypothetical protein
MIQPIAQRALDIDSARQLRELVEANACTDHHFDNRTQYAAERL